MPSLFLSYARGDDEPFVTRLFEDLTRAGFSVWWDRVSMPSRALTFLQEVQDAIAASDRMVVVIGAAALRSDYVRAEWQYGLHACKAVTPVLRAGTHEDLPEELRVLHAPDLREDAAYAHELDLLLRRLREPVPPPGPLIGVPEVPPHFLQRPEESHAIHDAVLADVTRPVTITGTAQRVGVQGMGGIGKSVLAAAFARTCEARRAFPDGVFWLTVGQTPPLTRRQAQLAEALGDVPRAFDDVEQGKARLSALLGEKRCLLVLDDVWETPHAAAFDALGPRGRVVITTRDRRITASLGAAECRIDVLSEAQSVTLLAEWSAHPRESLPPEAHEIVEECGRLPLALAIVGAMVRGHPGRWASALHRLRAADLERIARQFPNYPYPTLLRAIQVGVEALPPDVQARYLDFAAFPEDTPVPEAVLRTFWRPLGLDEHATGDVLDLLVDKSLMRRDVQGRVTLHDLQFDYVRSQCGDRTPLHRRLLDAYAAVCPDGWRSGPDDGYFFTHLAHHLVDAGRKDELRRLLLDFGWLQAKLRATSVAALLADFESFGEDRVLRAVESAIRLASHVVGTFRDELAGQLLGRLPSHGDPEIVAFLREVAAWSGAVWLRPIRPALTAAASPLVRTIVHGTGMKTFALLPDGVHALAGDPETIWDLRTGEARATLPHKSHFAALTRDGHAIRVDRNTLLRCSLETGKVLDWIGASRWIDRIVVVVGDHVVFTIDESVDLGFWNLSTGRLLVSADAPSVTTDVVALAETRALSSHYDGSIVEWDVATAAIRRRSRTLDGSVLYALAVTQDRRRVAVSVYRQVHFLDLASETVLWTASPFPTGYEGVRSIAVTADDRFVVCASDVNPFPSRGAFLSVLDAASGAVVRLLPAHSARVFALALLADGTMVSASADGTLKIWQFAAGMTRELSTPHSAAVGGVAISTDGLQALSGSYDRTLRVWDLASGETVRVLEEHLSGINAVAALPGGQAITASHDEVLKIWDCRAGVSLCTLQGHDADVCGVTTTADGRRAISVGNGVLIWDMHTGAMLRRAGMPARFVTVLTNDRYVGVGGHTIRISDIDSDAQMEQLPLSISINGVAAIADRALAFAGDDGYLRVFDLRVKALSREVPAGVGGLSAIAASADGRRVVTASWSGVIQLWDTETWVPLAFFHADGLLTCCAISAGGEYIIAGERSGQVHLLRVPSVR